MDIRSNAKLYDEFTRRAVEEYGTQYIRGRVSAIQPDGHGQYIVRGADTLLGKPVEVKADMVVLAVGIEGSKGANKLAETLHISYDGFGFFMESHCKLRPVETNTAGVFLAGVAQGPKDIPSSVAQGSGAAAKVIGLLSKPLLESDPADLRRGHQALRRLRQVHQGVPVPGHRRKGNSRRKEGADHRGRVPGLRPLHGYLPAGRHPALPLH